MPTPRIPASTHFRAVALLRWQLFRNGFRRKGGKGELIARIIVWPIALLFLLGPVAGAFFTSYFAAQKGRLDLILPIFTVIFLLQLVVSINISPPGLSFDPESLIRFPLSFPRYLTIRLFLGLLAASTIVGTLSLLSAATGISVVLPRLAPVAFAAALLLALANMLFIRMVFAWVDRWLSTRRARELFTALIFVFSIGFQYLNVTFNNVGGRPNHAAQTAKLAAATRFYHHVEPFVTLLPPGLAGSAILHAHTGSIPLALTNLLGILLFAALFLAIFARRTHREYRGENLSEASAQPAETKRVPHPLQSHRKGEGIGEADPSTTHATRNTPQAHPLLSPITLAVLQKEFLYVRRNPTQFYGLVAPLAMVFIFAGRFGRFASTGLVFPIAAAYSLLGIAALAYNLLGVDAAGVQFYFLAPVPLRSIFLGKNLFGFAISFVQIALLYAVLAFTTGIPGLWITLSTLAWLIFAVLANAALGNMRSVTAPKKVDPSKLSRKQTSQLSALISVGLTLAAGTLGAGLIALARFLGLPWLPLAVLLPLAAGAFALYTAGLQRLDALALNHRETLIEELSKVSV